MLNRNKTKPCICHQINALWTLKYCNSEISISLTAYDCCQMKITEWPFLTAMASPVVLSSEHGGEKRPQDASSCIFYVCAANYRQFPNLDCT